MVFWILKKPNLYQVQKQEYYLVCVSEFTDLSWYQVSFVFLHFYSIYILLKNKGDRRKSIKSHLYRHRRTREKLKVRSFQPVLQEINKVLLQYQTWQSDVNEWKKKIRWTRVTNLATSSKHSHCQNLQCKRTLVMSG